MPDAERGLRLLTQDNMVIRDICLRVGHHVLVHLESNGKPILRCDFCLCDFEAVNDANEDVPDA